MHVEFLLEEESAEAALRLLVPRLLPDCTLQFIPHQGKNELLKRLPGRLKTYARRLPAEPALRVVIMMDADADCMARKTALEQLVAEAGLVTKTAAAGRPFQVITRLAVAELEAWFLGDPAAIQAAYSRVHPKHFKGIHAVPDEIPDAWETLHRLLQKGGYYTASKAKVEWAETISQHLNLSPGHNASASFHYFCQGLAALR